MKANELRIGNLVYTKGEDIVIVNEINNDGINGEFDLCWASYFFENESIQPIPLTEEWLVKFGFNVYNKPGGYTVYIKYKPKTRQYLQKIYTFKD